MISVEYRAICLLSWLVPLYFVLWQLLSCLGIDAYVANNRASTALENGMSPFWVGAFNAVSAFNNNNGMSLLDANMTAFQDAYYMLITMGLLILAGDTCYPVFLRFIIWTMHAATPTTGRWSEHKSTLRYLLDHLRHCYKFPSRHTWWLLIAVIVLNLTDWIGLEVLNIGNAALNSALPLRLRVIDGLFQALAVRRGGIYVVAIPSLRISVQVMYVIMMYISVYPVVMIMRDSNVYEDRNLGIYSNDPTWRLKSQDKELRLQSIWRRISGLHRQPSSDADSRSNFVRQQFEGQLTDDLWWLVLAIFLLMIVEGSEFERNPALFSVFNVIFETVSTYRTVGISVGVLYADYSFCRAWKTLSKLILCAVMLRGRHRGLPVAIDSAILLPNEAHTRCSQEEAISPVPEHASQKEDDVR